jgi:hypothetical protein
MATPTKQDVTAEIERQFSDADRTAALKTVNLYTAKPGDREIAQLALLRDSGGSIEKLRSLVGDAKRSSGSRPAAGRPSEPARVSQPAAGLVSDQVARATAIAQLQGAHHVKGQDPELAVGSSKEYPPYRYFFYVAIGIIPVLTLGGAIPLAIAAGGISGCRKIATDARQPHVNRILLCLGIAVACWVVLFALVGGVALLRTRR